MSAAPPLDPRLLKYSPSARWYVVFTAVFQVATLVATIVAAFAIAGLLAEIITDPAARRFAAQATHLWVLGIALALRVGLGYLGGRYAHRAAYGTIGELRVQALERLTDPAHTTPRELLTVRERALTVLLRGLDSLVPYFAGYLPALLATVIITPAVVIVIAWVDLTSAILIIITLPLIPVFMVLIGLVTRDRTEKKLAAMSDQTAQLMDLITGLPTLRALGRAHGPAARVERLGQRLRTTTMQALRVAFLSGTALELIATLSVALVAVGIGLRLVYGEMTLYAGVLALILAPEAYLPLRQVGAQFHNSEDGMAAAREAMAFIDDDESDHAGDSDHADDAGADDEAAARRAPAASSTATVELDSVGVFGRDGWAPRGLSVTIEPGSVTVLAGPNGSGKSTVLALILGLMPPDEGTVTVDPGATVAWLPQHPVVLPGTVRENLELFGVADPGRLAEACAVTGFDDVLAELSDGMDTVLGAGGAGLSAGQRQRLALARVLAAPASLLLLDEPTAHLDPDSEDAVLAAIAERATPGSAVVMVAHHPEAVGIGDVVVELSGVADVH